MEEVVLNNNAKKVEIAKPEVKSVAGPPVYYPPGHKQLFDESMHVRIAAELFFILSELSKLINSTELHS